MEQGIWLVATEPLTIQGREVQAGERFRISRVHSGALLVMGRATVAPRLPPEPVAPVTRRRGRPRKITIESQNQDAGAVVDLAEPPKRRYRRRDLQADE